MPETLPFDIEIVRIRTVHMLHDLGEIGIGSLYKEMIMIGHEAVSMDDGPVTFMGLAEIFKELFPISLALVNIFSLVASGCHMVKRPGKRNP